jgi:hypothetical protein
MSRLETLEAERQRVDKNLNDIRRQIESLRYKADVLEDAIANETDIRQRGIFIMQKGSLVSEISDLTDQFDAQAAYKEEIETDFKQEVKFAEERALKPLPASPEPDGEADTAENDFLERRRLKRENKLKPKP